MQEELTEDEMKKIEARLFKLLNMFREGEINHRQIIDKIIDIFLINK